MFKKLTFILVVFIATNLIGNYKQEQKILAHQREQVRLELVRKEEEAKTALKLAEETKLKEQVKAQEEAKKAQEVAKTKPSVPKTSAPIPAPAVAGSCRDAINQVFPAHLRAGAIVVLQHENRGENPEAIGGVNKDGSRDYGCFQINSRWHKNFFATKNWKDPVHNAQQALDIYNGRKAREGNGWRAWYAVQGKLW